MPGCRWLVPSLVGGFLGIGCLESSTIRCATGEVCDSSRVCDNVHSLCVLPEQLTACAGLEDGTDCAFAASGAAQCREGVCLELTCGDGLLSGLEECETGVMEYTSCIELGFYEDIPLKCTQCLYDRVACQEAGAGYCGDNVRESTEYCDNSPPPLTDSCVTFGYDAGRLGCNNSFCAPAFDDCASLRWATSSPNLVASDIWSASSSDVYAVGRSGLLAHYDGTSWTQVPNAPVTSSLELGGVWGTASNDVHVVGGNVTADSGTALHFDGTAWTSMQLPGGTKLLHSVWVGDGTGFAVGNAGTLLKLVAGAWTQQTAPTSVSLNVVWGRSASEIYLGAGDGLYAYNGATWTKQTLASTGFIQAITGTSAGDVFVGGEDTNTFATLYRKAGSAWQPIPLPECSGGVQDLWASSATEVYAAGSGKSGKSRTLYQFDGSSWLPLASPAADNVLSLWGTADGDRWLSANAGMFRGEGRFFSVLPLELGNAPSCLGSNHVVVTSCASLPATAIAGRSATDIYAFGTEDGSITPKLCRYDGLNWTLGDFSVFDRAEAAWVAPDGTAFVVGADEGGDNTICPDIAQKDDTGIIRRGQGTTQWANVTGNPYTQAGGYSVFLDVWGTTSSDVWAVGWTGDTACDTTPSPLILRFNGTSWTAASPMPTGIARVYRVWGNASGVYILGDNATFMRFSGGAWTTLQPVPTFCGKNADMTGVGTDIFVTCTDRHLYRYDTTLASPSQPWETAGTPHGANAGRMHLVALSATDQFVVGGDPSGTGTITSFDNSTAYPVRYSGSPILGAFATPDRWFWVGADGVHSLTRSVRW